MGQERNFVIARALVPKRQKAAGSAPTPCEILRLALQHVLCCCRRRTSARAHKNAGVVGAHSGELEPVHRM